MNRHGSDPGSAAVRAALGAMRFRTAQVHGLVAHVTDVDPASSSLLLEPSSLTGGLRALEPRVSSLECVRTTAPGVALEVLTYLREEYGPRDREVRMQTPEAGGWRTSFQVRRTSEPVDHDTVTFEYLVVVPAEERRGREPTTVGLAALQLIKFVAANDFDISYTHAPASPPALRGDPCLPGGACARIGVVVPEARVHQMLGLGTDLVERVSAAGLHLWVHDTETPDALHDAWRRMYPCCQPEAHRPHQALPTTPLSAEVADAAEVAEVAEVADPEAMAPRLAVTCVGPARRGVIARLADRFAASRSRVWAVNAVKLDELVVAQGIIDARSLAACPTTPGSGRLHDLLDVGVGGMDAAPAEIGPAGAGDAIGGDDPLAEFRVFWSPLGPAPTGDPARRVLWMRWTVGTDHQLSPDVVASAWAAVRDACARWAPDKPTPDPRVDYVISRVETRGVLEGRAKIVLDLDAVRDHWPEGADNGHWLRRFCAEVEDRWRTDVEAVARPHWSNLAVGWSETWLTARATPRR